MSDVSSEVESESFATKSWPLVSMAEPCRFPLRLQQWPPSPEATLAYLKANCKQTTTAHTSRSFTPYRLFAARSESAPV